MLSFPYLCRDKLEKNLERLLRLRWLGPALVDPSGVLKICFGGISDRKNVTEMLKKTPLKTGSGASQTQISWRVEVPFKQDQRQKRFVNTLKMVSKIVQESRGGKPEEVTPDWRKKEIKYKGELLVRQEKNGDMNWILEREKELKVETEKKVAEHEAKIKEAKKKRSST